MATSGTKPRSGKGGRVKINGTIVKMKSWSFNPSAPGINVSNFESVADANGHGYSEYVGDFLDADISVSGTYDAGQNPMDPPINLTPGVTLTNVLLYISVADNNPITINALYVERVPLNIQVGDVCKIEFSGKASGSWSWQPGSF